MKDFNTKNPIDVFKLDLMEALDEISSVYSEEFSNGSADDFNNEIFKAYDDFFEKIQNCFKKPRETNIETKLSELEGYITKLKYNSLEIDEFDSFSTMVEQLKLMYEQSHYDAFYDGFAEIDESAFEFGLSESDEPAFENHESAEIQMDESAEVSINQENILNKLSEWLEIKSQTDSENNTYSLPYVNQLREELKLGHCSGFSWIHRIYMNRGEYFYFKTLMQSIAKCDLRGPLSPEIDKLFNELLQTLIYAQQDISFISAINAEDMKLNPELFTTQHSDLIAKNIQPSESVRILADPMLIHSDSTYEKYTREKLKQFIDKYSQNNGMIYLSGKTKSKNIDDLYAHGIDVGKTEIDGKTVYWLYDPNASNGRSDYDNFDSFFNALTFAFNYKPPLLSLELSAHAYTPIIEYKHHYSDILNIESKSIIDVLTNDRAKYDYFEIATPDNNYMYIKFEKGKYILNPFNTGNEDQSMTFNNEAELLSYLSQNDMTSYEISGIEIRAPELPTKTLKKIVYKLFESDNVDGLARLVKSNPEIISWIKTNQSFESKRDLPQYMRALESEKSQHEIRVAPYTIMHSKNTRVEDSAPIARHIHEKPSRSPKVK